LFDAGFYTMLTLSRPEAIDTSPSTPSATAPAAIQSPVPLNRDEEGSAEVRALAAALAPTLVAADELLQGTLDLQSVDGTGSNIDKDVMDDDDDLDNEVEALGASEALLRQELDLAQDFSKLFAFAALDSPERALTPPPPPPPTIQQQAPFFPEQDTPNVHPAISEALATSAAGDDDDDDDSAGLHSIVDPKLAPIPLPPSPPKATPSTPRRNTAGGLDDCMFAMGSTPYSSRKGSTTVHYTPRDHAAVLGLRREESGGWYSIGLAQSLGLDTATGTSSSSSSTITTTTTTTTLDLNDAVKEYCLSMPDIKLRQLYAGLPEPRSTLPLAAPVVLNDAAADADMASHSNNSSPHDKALSSPTQPTATSTGPLTAATALPVRTVAIRIRPDVLCGAVMEAVHHALTDLNANVTKRQGGHIQAVVRRAHFDTVVSYAPYHVDFRLATYKSNLCERTLLIRIYHLDVAMEDSDETVVDERPQPEDLVTSAQDEALDHAVGEGPALRLREAAALVQRMEAPQTVKRIHPRVDARNLTPQLCTEMVSRHLLDHYRACPSAVNGGITLPALNASDFTVIQSSWRMIQSVFEELETRDLSFTTLRSRSFGSFPSLPTLDVHFCAHIRRISREAMTARVVKTAFGLEQYAREAELACANLISLLKPTFAAYGIDAPPLPKPKQLTEYPLDFVVPQTLCPPWGDKVQHALNEIQAWTGKANGQDPINAFSSEHSVDEEKSLELATAAVQLVLEAFRRQDDEEQSARLGRKNVQVMDRLAKMQLHEKLSIQTLQNCTNVSEKAIVAAQDFEQRSGVREVPLLKWSIDVGHSTGTCTVSANHILFATQLIPVLGGISKTRYALDDVDFNLTSETSNSGSSGTASVLKSHAASIHVVDAAAAGGGREVLYSFRPLSGAARLKSFLDVVKAAQVSVPLDIPDPEVHVMVYE
jgi:Leucine-rich repeat (LRR) protein